MPGSSSCPPLRPILTDPERPVSQLFRTIASDDAQAKLEVDFAINRLKVKTIAVLHDKGDYGKGLAEYARKFAAASQKSKWCFMKASQPGAVDYSAIVQKIKQSGAEAVIYGGYHPEAASVVSQMRKKGMKTIFLSDDGVKDITFIKVAGKNAEGVYATGPKDTSKTRWQSPPTRPTRRPTGLNRVRFT